MLLNNRLTKQLPMMLCAVLVSLNAYSDSYQKIVSVDGSITEILYALEQQHRLVGRDTTSIWPEAAKELPDVGYMRQLSSEGLLSLQPDLILVTADAQPQSVLDQLKAAGVNVHIIENDYSLQGVQQKILSVARIVEQYEKGVELVASLDAEMMRIQDAITAQHQEPVSAIFVLGIRNGSMMVAGSGSRADALLRMAGLHNPFSDQVQNYQSVSAEALIRANPDIIITMSQGADMGGGIEQVLQDPAIRLTRAGQQKNVLVVDARLLSFGPDLPAQIEDLYQQVNLNSSNNKKLLDRFAAWNE
ncbi:heme/hemin ABC transporter substrate-binding protein [Nitrincola alkalisediminis]|uniref:heme/hemin ABC transporter substrate-binding protein n=1 Tax=Nitrincola alkalisediminis TaxID=1366656 RepID=UPI0018768935|nr:helical backbone metal receptor [Nitrincola alkalisediminis]